MPLKFEATTYGSMPAKASLKDRAIFRNQFLQKHI
jgi:hypothetical protein